MATNKTYDFLRFSAYSIKDLITRKLSEDSNFTDQVYEGSNLAILIDIVSYMYQCLIYNLNNAASESMFSDTQLYENIVRLCKFIGYHPMGYQPAKIHAFIDNTTTILSRQIYPCTAIDIGTYDANGNKIYFSTTYDYENNYQPVNVASTEPQTNLMLTNGVWKYYANVLVASGIDYETFILDGLMSDSSKKKYVANNKIQVFVESNGEFERWTNDPNEIFIRPYDSTAMDSTFSKLYNENDKVYTAYLNENKTFEIKFGNGISGRKLLPGDRIHILYLDTNGPDGYFDPSSIELTKQTQLHHSATFFGMSDEVYKKIFGENAAINNISLESESITVSFDVDSLTKTRAEEEVEDVRNNAPQWFKTGNRLITKKDYEYFIKSNRNGVFSGVVDVKCMNNWDYMTTFYRWLYNLGINPCPMATAAANDSGVSLDPYRYMSKARLIQSGYEYVDAADANNIYLWIATSDKNTNSKIISLKSDLNNQIAQIKTMTSETYPLAPIEVYFDISFTPSELYYENLVKDENSAFDATNSYLEVTIADNIIYSTTSMLNMVSDIITQAFSVDRCSIGQTINYDAILEQIYSINGVERVRTVYYPEDYLENSSTYSQYKARACDGISFASWSKTKLINIGDDLEINNTMRQLQQFQFPKLVPDFDIKQKIKIIKKSMNTTSPIKF